MLKQRSKNARRQDILPPRVTFLNLQFADQVWAGAPRARVRFSM